MADEYQEMDSNEKEKSVRYTTLDRFAEAEEVFDLIANIPHAVSNQIAKEMSDEHFTEIVDEYLELPHLLDPFLDDFLQKLLKYIQDINTPVKELHCAFKYLYLLTKVRGPKVMVKKFPHEVADLEPILGLLFKQDISDQDTWETRYMLLLWLSMICLIPFDMVRFDAHGIDSDVKKKPIIERMLEIGKLYLVTSSDRCQEAAALFLSKFVTRPDIFQQYLITFFNWCLLEIASSDPTTMTGITKMKGCLSAVALIFKQGKRDDLLDHCSYVLEKVQACNILDVKNTVLRKLVVKITQRIGMTLLKPRIANWRYQRGSRSLDQTLKATPVDNEPAVFKMESETDEDYDIPEDVENILEVVLNGLKDKDTVVRWSAAKGVGRITGRLPKELADEVVGSVLENFTISESHTAWHGSCLALAELGRRGLLLPVRLRDVVPVLLKSLAYDERRGSSSVGAHVRDAACYLAWSFARAYAPETMKKYVKSIAQSLLITTTFDREVNCRRAASAAFQENVGRQGHFPHGIDILTKADYFAVSNCSNAYLRIAPYIARYAEYTEALILHLTDHKRDHWDNNIRWLAAQSMHKLTKLKPNYVASNVLQKLLPLCTGMDLLTRHGSIIIVAEIMHSLHEIESKNPEKHYGLASRNPSLKNILRIVQHLTDSKLFRGGAGEVMRVAACHLIARLAQCNETIIVPKHTNECWLELIHGSLSNLQDFGNAEEICNTAISALSAINQVTLVAAPFANLASGNDTTIADAVDLYLSHLSSSSEKQRCGYAHAIASLPKPVIQNCFMKVCHALFRASRVLDKSETKTFALARCDAIYALSRICQTAGVVGDEAMNAGICRDNVELIYDTLFNALDDYTRSQQGDIGSYVRMSAIKALREVTLLIAEQDSTLLESSIISKTMCGIFQQSCEKIHKVRDLAICALTTLLHVEKVPNIPSKKELEEIFPDQLKTNWYSMEHLFDLMSKLLDDPIYSQKILTGFIVSVGDLTQSLAEASGNALFSFMDAIGNDRVKLDRFASNFIQIFEKFSRQDRVSVPLLKTLQQLLMKDCFALMNDSDDDDAVAVKFQEDLIKLMKAEIFKCKDTQKILISIPVLCGMLQFQRMQFRKSVLYQLMILLCHRFPVVRRIAAEQLYELVITYDDLVKEDGVEIVITNLGELEWDGDIEVVRPIRNQLCSCFDVPTPKLIKKADPTN